jgi:hypothetical protein
MVLAGWMQNTVVLIYTCMGMNRMKTLFVGDMFTYSVILYCYFKFLQMQRKQFSEALDVTKHSLENST